MRPKRPRVLVRFFPCSVYTDLNRRGTLGYEWSLSHCCHLKDFYVMLDGSSGFCYTSRRMLTTLLIIGFLHVLVYRLQI
jgi:hypothetical protein